MPSHNDAFQLRHKSTHSQPQEVDTVVLIWLLVAHKRHWRNAGKRLDYHRKQSFNDLELITCSAYVFNSINLTLPIAGLQSTIELL
jgi:hypothetical protein